MPTIAIVDDRLDHRTTLKRRLDSELIDDWNSIAIEPFAQVEDYPCWFTENDIGVLLLDERLNEQTVTCKYNGHELVEFLRSYMPTFPIFVITSYPDDEELRKKFKDVEAVIERKVFSKDAADYVPRIIRSAQKYFETFQDELAKLSDLARKVAQGIAGKEDFKELKAIQTKLGLSFPLASFNSRNEWLNEFECKLDELKKLSDEIKEFLESKK
jgi:FixJ family two-component response regulator